MTGVWLQEAAVNRGGPRKQSAEGSQAGWHRGLAHGSPCSWRWHRVRIWYFRERKSLCKIKRDLFLNKYPCQFQHQRWRISFMSDASQVRPQAPQAPSDKRIPYLMFKVKYGQCKLRPLQWRGWVRSLSGQEVRLPTSLSWWITYRVKWENCMKIL